MSWAGFGRKDWGDERRLGKGSIVWQRKCARESSGPEEWREGLVSTQEEGYRTHSLEKQCRVGMFGYSSQLSKASANVWFVCVCAKFEHST